MSRHGHMASFGGHGSINSVSTDFWLANHFPGMQINGRMSAVRRFFCLFVTFDFLFTSLFWAICVLDPIDEAPAVSRVLLQSGDDGLLWSKKVLDKIVLLSSSDDNTALSKIEKKGKYEALVEEIICYNIQSSIFDVVMVAASRFIILLLFYALLHINHWWMVAITTAGSCGFFICKSLMYKWSYQTSYPFEVTLVLLSFFIAWIEAWFVDFRVLPQEARAKSILEAASNCDHLETDPLLPQLERVRDYLSHYSESIREFYSPVESLIGSDEEDEEAAQSCQRKLSPQEREFQMSGLEAMQKAWETINSSGWKLEKESSHGDTIYSKLGPRGSKIYKLMGVVDIDASVLFNEFTHNFENIPSWNKAITLGRVVQKIDSCTDVVYQVAAEGPGGIVSARDFVCVRHWKKIDNSWVCAVISIICKDEPPQKNIVRGENGPGCWVFQPDEEAPKKCSFHWLLDTDLKGWIPQYVIDQALTHAMTDFMSCLRSYAPALKAVHSQQRAAR